MTLHAYIVIQNSNISMQKKSQKLVYFLSSNVAELQLKTVSIQLILPKLTQTNIWKIF
jgi:hypothetical protein